MSHRRRLHTSCCCKACQCWSVWWQLGGRHWCMQLRAAHPLQYFQLWMILSWVHGGQCRQPGPVQTAMAFMHQLKTSPTGCTNAERLS